MAEAFYPFVENGSDANAQDATSAITPRYAARIAVYDDPLSTPRVVEIAPTDTRSYLEQITEATNRLAHEAGSHIPFMVTREIVENLIHAYFAQPTISILDHGDTITFSDQGPGIADKELAKQYGTTSATAEMRTYIRGVGSGLPYVEAWLDEHDGRLEIRDNIAGGTMVTISLISTEEDDEPVLDNAGAQPTYPAAVQTSYPGVPNAPFAQPFYQQFQAPMPQMVPTQPVSYPYQPQYQTQPAPQPSSAWTQVSAPAFNQREKQVLDYLATHGSVGPTDLSRAYGESVPTWTRVLKSLDSKGILRKEGQKRCLTEAGKQFLAQ